MKSTVIIFPYFGILPIQYKMWRASALCNPTIDYLFLLMPTWNQLRISLYIRCYLVNSNSWFRRHLISTSCLTVHINSANTNNLMVIFSMATLKTMISGDCFYDKNVLENLSGKGLSSDIIFGREYHFKESTQQGFATILPSRISMLTFVHNTLPHQSTFFKRELFKNSLYDESLRLVADVKFYIQKICVEQCSIQL